MGLPACHGRGSAALNATSQTQTETLKASSAISRAREDRPKSRRLRGFESSDVPCLIMIIIDSGNYMQPDVCLHSAPLLCVWKSDEADDLGLQEKPTSPTLSIYQTAWHAPDFLSLSPVSCTYQLITVGSTLSLGP